MLRDVTRLEAGSLLRDFTRLGNDNHSQIARIKKPLFGAWIKVERIGLLNQLHLAVNCSEITDYDFLDLARCNIDQTNG